MMGIEWEIPRGLRSFFWVCYFHEVGLSRKKPGYSKVNIRIKKDLMKHGECVLHKVFISYPVLGFLRISFLALFRGLQDRLGCPISFELFPLVAADCILNNFVYQW